ncbi:MAG: hypothetical protein KAS12_06510 [Candidatus Aenigmarchaeota archaeon]|nr:hypothetical protein [Candidatus Aenigmarchaeota archaeon]
MSTEENFDNFDELLEKCQEISPNFVAMSQYLYGFDIEQHLPAKDYKKLAQSYDQFFIKRLMNSHPFFRNMNIIPGFDYDNNGNTRSVCFIEKNNVITISSIQLIGYHLPNDQFEWLMPVKLRRELFSIIPKIKRVKYQQIWEREQITGITCNEADGIATLVDMCTHANSNNDNDSTNLMVFNFNKTLTHISLPLSVYTRIYYLINYGPNNLIINRKTVIGALRRMLR